MTHRPTTLPYPTTGFVAHLRAEWIRHWGFWWLESPELRSRCLDVAVGLGLALLLAPFWLPRALWGRLTTGRWLEVERRLGRRGELLRLWRFAGPAAGAETARLWNVLRGDLALTGPEPAAPRGADMASERAWDTVRFQVRPGLVSPYAMRRRLGIAYEDERSSRQRLVLGRQPASNLGLLVRALPALALGRRRCGRALLRVDVLGVGIDNLSIGEALRRILWSAETARPCRVSFVNPDCLNIAVADRAYRRALVTGDLTLADGVGTQLAGHMLGRPLRANLNGTDLFPMLCAAAADKDLPIFLLGARPGVAAEVARRMTSRYPGLRVVGVADGYATPAEEPALIERVRRSGARLLFVALGAPKQELWSARHHRRLGVPVVLGVGGLFDFYSGRVPRAPQAWRDMGLEWLWRLRCEPGRLWKRYVLGNPLFLWRVVRQRLDERLGRSASRSGIETRPDRLTSHGPVKGAYREPLSLP